MKKLFYGEDCIPALMGELGNFLFKNPNSSVLLDDPLMKIKLPIVLATAYQKQSGTYLGNHFIDHIWTMQLASQFEYDICVVHRFEEQAAAGFYSENLQCFLNYSKNVIVSFKNKYHVNAECFKDFEKYMVAKNGTIVPDCISDLWETKIKSKYPHKCPICNNQAYVGFSSVECSQKDCKNAGFAKLRGQQ